MSDLYKRNKLSQIEDEPEGRNIPFFTILIIVIIIISLFRHFSFDNTVLRNVDMQPFSEPIQENIEDGTPFQHKVSEGVATITPLANYKIYGRVLVRHFRPSKLPMASMYPYDVTIGFGDFRYKEVINAMQFKMASTTSYYSWSASAYKKHLYKYFKDKSIHHYWTNNHICPANKNIRKGIAKLKKKDIVYIEGYLVKYELHKKNGTIEKGTSSTVRNDEEPNLHGNNGNGTCEQIYVTRVVSRHGDYR